MRIYCIAARDQTILEKPAWEIMVENEGKCDTMLLHVTQQHSKGIEEVSSSVTKWLLSMLAHVYMHRFITYILYFAWADQRDCALFSIKCKGAVWIKKQL